MKRTNWLVLPKTFALYIDGNLFEAGYQPLRLFFNTKTGECRFFGKSAVDKIGTDEIIKILNTK